MTAAENLAQAEARAAAARAKLNGTVEALQTQLEPRRLAREAAEGVSEHAQQAARLTGDAVQRNPGAAAGGAALVVFLLTRKRLARMGKRIFSATRKH